MTKRIYVVYSRAQDECTINNKAFEEYTPAWEYKQFVEEQYGCEMVGPISMELITKTDF